MNLSCGTLTISAYLVSWHGSIRQTTRPIPGAKNISLSRQSFQTTNPSRFHNCSRHGSLKAGSVFSKSDQLSWTKVQAWHFCFWAHLRPRAMSAFMPADIALGDSEPEISVGKPPKIWRARHCALSLRSSSELAVYFAVYP